MTVGVQGDGGTSGWQCWVQGDGGGWYGLLSKALAVDCCAVRVPALDPSTPRTPLRKSVVGELVFFLTIKKSRSNVKRLFFNAL
jgi:hypothetical protein